MPARFAKDLRDALEKFDYRVAEELLDQVRSAEEAGYELTTREENLLNRLVRCVDTYRRASSHVG
jgi:hypothetical protein